VANSRHNVRLSGLPFLKGENNISVKVPKGFMNETTHVGESTTG
jgi:hypothetical protein